MTAAIVHPSSFERSKLSAVPGEPGLEGTKGVAQVPVPMLHYRWCRAMTDLLRGEVLVQAAEETSLLCGRGKILGHGHDVVWVDNTSS